MRCLDNNKGHKEKTGTHPDIDNNYLRILEQRYNKCYTEDDLKNYSWEEIGNKLISDVNNKKKDLDNLILESHSFFFHSFYIVSNFFYYNYLKTLSIYIKYGIYF
jgi:hypothetical protein